MKLARDSKGSKLGYDMAAGRPYLSGIQEIECRELGAITRPVVTVRSARQQLEKTPMNTRGYSHSLTVKKRMIYGDQQSRLPEEVAQLRRRVEVSQPCCTNADGACRLKLAKIDRFVRQKILRVMKKLTTS